jgi:iron(III) transport system substrate-binding protein
MRILVGLGLSVFQAGRGALKLSACPETIATVFVACASLFELCPSPAHGQERVGKTTWERTIKAASDEGKLVVSIPPGGELRKGIGEKFSRRFGIAAELVPARGSTVVRRIAEEARAGVRHFDLHIGGSESIVKGLLPLEILEPIEPWLILPEVREPRNWWGGQLWVDKTQRFVYAFSAYQTATIWHNATLPEARRIGSLDDLLGPRWKGQIGFSDPRIPSAGASMWSYMWQTKGENYLRALVRQNMVVVADSRVLAENLAKGSVALAIGITYAEALPFMNAGLPVRPVPTPKEELYATGGYGNLTLIKDPPHPNAARLFVNWLLSKEGQEIFTQAMGSATRRFDVDTRWLKKYFVVPAKDELTLEQYHRLENQSEEKIYKVRDPALKLARELLN